MAQLMIGKEDSAILGFQNLYSSYGYNKFKMNRFEEYDLYANNKSFLVCDNVITFTDTNGKLLALKPDVTLSIVKNAHPEENSLQKLYYSENVYRVAAKTKEFKEIMQIGLECIGKLDDYAVLEVVLLAAKSLEMLDSSYILDISNMNFAAGLLDESSLSDESKNLVMRYIGEKNVDMIKSVFASENDESGIGDKLISLVTLYAPFDVALDVLKTLSVNDKTESALAELASIGGALSGSEVYEHIRLDFSLVSDMNYYNGITFAGYVHGVPEKVLSGGRYDNLMKRFSKNCGAIGFAVYLDALEQLLCTNDADEVDYLILYDESSSFAEVYSKAAELTALGKRVRTASSVPSKLRYKELISFGVKK